MPTRRKRAELAGERTSAFMRNVPATGVYIARANPPLRQQARSTIWDRDCKLQHCKLRFHQAQRVRSSFEK